MLIPIALALCFVLNLVNMLAQIVRLTVFGVAWWPALTLGCCLVVVSMVITGALVSRED